MPHLTAEEQSSFLHKRSVLMRVSVVRENGSPLVTPIWFLFEDEAIYFTPRARSEWFDCLKRDPRVALCIDEQPLPYRKVIVEGAAEPVDAVHEDGRFVPLLIRRVEVARGHGQVVETVTVQIGGRDAVRPQGRADQKGRRPDKRTPGVREDLHAAIVVVCNGQILVSVIVEVAEGGRPRLTADSEGLHREGG